MKTFLHVGCGTKRKDRTTKALPSWNELRFDIDASVNPDLIGTMTDMSTVSSDSVDCERRRPHRLNQRKQWTCPNKNTRLQLALTGLFPFPVLRTCSHACSDLNQPVFIHPAIHRASQGGGIVL
jgi:hypothetical protein